MLLVNNARLLRDLADLSAIGRTEEGGVSRPALSPADVAGRAWYRERVREAGLDFHQDGAGNLSAVLPASDPAASTLLAGSHLDSVPNGGRFDGALGVLCALEVLRTLRQAGISLRHHLEAISFTDEEGAFMGTLGSLAFAGRVSQEDLAHVRQGSEALAAGLERLRLSPQSLLGARRPPQSLAGYVEVHIEQGARLEEADCDIGIVTAIVGIRSFWLRFMGEAAHAGTMPMSRRADALWGAASFASRAHELVMERFSPGVMNCGVLQLSPGSFNIVPGEARLALEFRHSADDLLDEMQAALFALAEEKAGAYGLRLQVEPAGRSTPAAMDEGMMAAVARAAEGLGLSHMRLPSLAGHDARSLSLVTPTTLFFVPSLRGISHNPAEYTADEDVINAANVLLHTLLNVMK